jgi:hypothetical protein
LLFEQAGVLDAPPLCEVVNESAAAAEFGKPTADGPDRGSSTARTITAISYLESIGIGALAFKIPTPRLLSRLVPLLPSLSSLAHSPLAENTSLGGTGRKGRNSDGSREQAAAHRLGPVTRIGPVRSWLHRSNEPASRTVVKDGPARIPSVGHDYECNRSHSDRPDGAAAVG